MFRIKCDINYIKIVYRLPSIKKQMIASGVIGNFLENFPKGNNSILPVYPFPEEVPF